MKRYLDAIPSILFGAAFIMVFVLFGYVTRATGAWPDRIIAQGWAAGQDLSAHFQGYIGLEPTRHIHVEPRYADGVSISDTDRMEPGVTFLTGFFDNDHAMLLVDHEGNELHRWTVNLFETFPSLEHVQPAESRPRDNWQTHLHGAYPLPDGSVVFNFDLHGLVRVDACGAPTWTLDRMAHHAISRGDDGTFWVPSRVHHLDEVDRLPMMQPPFYEDQVLQVSEDGEVLKTISLPEVFYKNDMLGDLFANGVRIPTNADPDMLHTNDAQVLNADVASAFPMFETGDLAVSMRDLNLVMVIDPDTGKVKWKQTGPWLRQHDPDFLADGTISVFDNRSDGSLFGDVLGGSRIVKVNPETGQSTVVFKRGKDQDQRRFYTHIMGKHQFLPNGNLLVTETIAGRVMEVTPNGDVVWQYVNRYDDERTALITSALRYPQDHFEFLGTSCKTAGETS